jgi:hypothetical protein
MNADVAELLETAKRVSIGMIKVAAAKPNDYPLQSNAETFRGAANILSALSLEVARVEERTDDLLAKLQRIADLKVRGAADAIEQGDWKFVVEELQAIAQEALVPGSSLPNKPRGPRDVPRRPAQR